MVFLYFVNFQVSSFVSNVNFSEAEDKVENNTEVREIFDVTYTSQSTYFNIWIIIFSMGRLFYLDYLKERWKGYVFLSSLVFLIQ